MTVESNNAISFTTLSDLRESLATAFYPMRSKVNTNRILYALVRKTFFRLFCCPLFSVFAFSIPSKALILVKVMPLCSWA